MTAGVTPELGDTVSPAMVDLIENGVLPPPGSVTDSACVATLRSQKFPRNAITFVEAVRRAELFKLPTGSTRTPESETEYIVAESLVRTLLPVVFSGSCSSSSG